MGILGLGRKKKGIVEDVAPEPEVVEEPTGPALMLLIPEVAGGTTFRTLRFRGPSDTAEYLAALHPAAVPQIHAFWAMMENPGESSDGGEALVLIRSAENEDLVYVVSFVDIESALSFARFEVKRGMQLGQMMVYWAELVTITRTDDGYDLAPSEPPAMTPEAVAAAMATLNVSPSLEKARLRQEQEKARLQAELEEIRQRQAQSEEMHRRQAQIEDKRKQLALAEKARRQTKAEEQRRLQEEAKEIEKLRAEAEELRKRQAEAEEHEREEAQTRRLQAEEDKKARLQAAAEEEKRLQDELEEIERQQAKAEERERQEAADREHRAAAEEQRRQAEAVEMGRLQAEAEELAHQLTEELRLLEVEEKGRRRADREAKPRLQAEAEQTRLLQEELAEIKRQQIEAEKRWRQETDERRLLAEAEEEQRREEEREKRRLEAEEEQRIQAELAEIKRQQAEAAELSLRTEEDENRRQAEAERAGRLQVGLQQIKRQQMEAQERWRQESEERRLRAEAEERQRREAEDDKRRLEAEETRVIQAKLEDIRHRLAEAQGAGSETEVVESPQPGESLDDVTPDGLSEPLREFSLEPQLDREDTKLPQDAQEDSRVSRQQVAEPPVREFSLEPSRPAPLWAEESDAGVAAQADAGELESQSILDAATEDTPVVADEPALADEEPMVAHEAEEDDQLLKAETFEAEATGEEVEATAVDADVPAFDDADPLPAQPPSFLRGDGADPPVDDYELRDEPITPQMLQEVDEAEGEAWAQPPTQPDNASGEAWSQTPAYAEEPTESTSDRQNGDTEDATSFPYEEPVPAGAHAAVNGSHVAAADQDEPPEAIPGEEQLSPDMAAFLRSRRRDKKDNPFKGFESPPGRF